MIVVLKSDCSDAEVAEVVDRLHEQGIPERIIQSGARTLVAAAGNTAYKVLGDLELRGIVEWIIPTVSATDVSVPAEGRTREIAIGAEGAVLGGQRLGIVAGPCSVEDEVQLMETAFAVKEAGAVGLRGGAFKPRTNPYSFQGLGERALELLAQARETTGLAVVTEVMSSDQVAMVARYADVLQIGTRSMHNFNLLKAAGQTPKPILLKRGWSATLDEFLHAAEYIINEGNNQIILCERGIRTFENHVRNTLALATIPAVKQRSFLPIMVDPSQGTGVAQLVGPMCKAAVACGADGLLIEVHPDPSRAITDGDQTIEIEQFQNLMVELKAIAKAVDRTL